MRVWNGEDAFGVEVDESSEDSEAVDEMTKSWR